MNLNAATRHATLTSYRPKHISRSCVFLIATLALVSLVHSRRHTALLVMVQQLHQCRHAPFSTGTISSAVLSPTRMTSSVLVVQ
jgi:hypothetical protein